MQGWCVPCAVYIYPLAGIIFPSNSIQHKFTVAYYEKKFMLINCCINLSVFNLSHNYVKTIK